MFSFTYFDKMDRIFANYHSPSTHNEVEKLEVMDINFCLILLIQNLRPEDQWKYSDE